MISAEKWDPAEVRNVKVAEQNDETENKRLMQNWAWKMADDN